ncbi:hypothetical protein PODOV006v2_p0005 [Vibrio phage 15E36.1]|uniref:Pectate lyase superfamily protein domain-containing protein n=1 Tax=Vibrio phage 15E36.1 TaxID=2859290 RepID=A0AAE8C8M1_9CAUD|nr:hypothetical protein PODOV006v2_p0005 [Vibrio phage 15E36.1]
MALTNLTKPRARWMTFKSKLVGAIQRAIADKLMDATSVKDFGAKGDYLLEDGSVNPNPTNDTSAFIAALATGKNIYVPRSQYYVPDSTLLVATNGQSIYGDGAWASVLVTEGAQSVILVSANYTNLKGFGTRAIGRLAADAHGIEVGNRTGGGGSRCSLTDVLTDRHGGDGLRINDGNLGTLHDIISLSNGGHGVHFTDENPDNNAWNQTGRVDLRGNLGNGFHIPSGSGASDPNASKSHNFTFICAQQNVGYGLYIGTRSNIINYYSEANTGGSAFLANDDGAEGNLINAVEGGSPAEQGTNTTSNNNILTDNNFDARYARIFRNMFMENSFIVERRGNAGKLTVEVDETTQRKFNVKGWGSGGGGWLMDFTAGATGDEGGMSLKALSLNAETYSTPRICTDGSIINIGSTNAAVLKNTAPITSNGVSGWRAGKVFTVKCDGVTTISGSNVHRKAGSLATPAAGTILMFVCDPETTNRIVEIGTSV